MELTYLQRIVQGLASLEELEDEYPVWGAQLLLFVKEIHACCEEAYGRLSKVLVLVRQLPDNPSQDELRNALNQALLAPSSDWFRNIAGICGRLELLVKDFEPFLMEQLVEYPLDRQDQRERFQRVETLLLILSGNEDKLKKDLENVARETSKELEIVRSGGSLKALREYAADMQERIDANMEKIMRLTMRIESTSKMGAEAVLETSSFAERRANIEREGTPLAMSYHFHGETIMGDVYRDNQGLAFGPGAHADNAHDFQIFKVAAADIDLSKLAESLANLRSGLRKEASDPQHDQTLGEVASAEAAAKSGNGEKALSHLKKAGEWALEVATKIGETVAVSAIKKSMGLGG